MSLKDIEWPEHKGYKKRMNLPARVLLFLGIIHYASEKKYGGLEFIGKYSYRLANPLTWLLCILLYLAVLICWVIHAVCQTNLDIGGMIRDGVEVCVPIQRNQTQC